MALQKGQITPVDLKEATNLAVESNAVAPRIRQDRVATQQAKAQSDWRKGVSEATGMQSYDEGTNFVPTTGPAILHQGEAVVPAAQNPAAQPAAAQPAPAATQPAAPSAQPRVAQPPTPKSLHSSIFDGVLRTLGGGTQYINKTDPATGETTQVPIQQSKGQLGKSILAGALAGLFGGMDARDAEGRHDPMKAAAEGFQAGQKPMQDRVAALQQTADEDTSRRQMVMKNNIDLVHQQMAMTQQNHAMLESTIADNKAGVLADAEKYDQTLAGADANDPSKKALQASGLTHDQALQRLNGHWSDTLAIISGQQLTRNAQGVMEAEPLYSLLNPNVTLKMSDAQSKEFARYKPGYQGAYDKTDGNLKVGMHNYVADTHEYNSYQHAESSLDRVQTALDSEGVDLAALASGKDGQAVKQAVLDMENASAQGGDVSAILKRLQGTGGGNLILKDMHISDADISQYQNEQIRNAKLAQEGGLGDKTLMPNAEAELRKNGLGLGLTPAQLENAIGKVPPQGFTVGEYRQTADKIQSQANTNSQAAAAKEKESGNPKDIDTLSDQLLQPNNLTSMRDIGTRGTQRESIIAEASRKAKERGIPFDVGLVNERIDFLKDYMKPTGKDSMNRRSLNNLVQHSGNLAELNHGVESRAANTVVNSIESQFGNETYQKFLTEVAVVKDEVANYFAGGFAPNKDQKATWDKILTNNATPNQIEAFAKTIIPEAAIRLDSTAEQFKEAMGYDDPNLVYPQTKIAAQKLGLGQVFDKYKSGGQLNQTLPATQPKASGKAAKYAQ
jgi:ribosomal protein S15P/S13E